MTNVARNLEVLQSTGSEVTDDLDWLIVTQGKKGASSVDRTGSVLQVAATADIMVVDTVGAGDAFASVAILGLLREWPYELIIERAQRFAALLVGTRGATLTESAPYQALLAEWL